jgi:RNA polymerase sigma-70 factor (ECF subfamily)
VLLNLTVDAHRSRTRERAALDRAAQAHRTAPTHAAEPSTDEFWEVVRDLPERQRLTVALHYLDDLSVDEIAEVMQVTSGTVKAALFAARKTLASTWDTEEVRDDDDR